MRVGALNWGMGWFWETVPKPSPAVDSCERMSQHHCGGWGINLGSGLVLGHCPKTLSRGGVMRDDVTMSLRGLGHRFGAWVGFGTLSQKYLLPSSDAR